MLPTTVQAASNGGDTAEKSTHAQREHGRNRLREQECYHLTSLIEDCLIEAEHLVTHHAVAQHIGAAGIGGEVAADLAAALGAQTQREEAPGGIRCLLHLREHAAGLGNE